jgi:hypothetical protein
MKDPPGGSHSKPVLDPVIEAYKKDIDVTLLRENLRLTVDQHFQQLMKAGQKARQKP